MLVLSLPSLAVRFGPCLPRNERSVYYRQVFDNRTHRRLMYKPEANLLRNDTADPLLKLTCSLAPHPYVECFSLDTWETVLRTWRWQVTEHWLNKCRKTAVMKFQAPKMSLFPERAGRTPMLTCLSFHCSKLYFVLLLFPEVRGASIRSHVGLSPQSMSSVTSKKSLVSSNIMEFLPSFSHLFFLTKKVKGRAFANRGREEKVSEHLEVTRPTTTIERTENPENQIFFFQLEQQN